MSDTFKPTEESDIRLVQARFAMEMAESEFMQDPTEENFKKSRDAYEAWKVIIDERREARRKAETQ